MTRGPFGDRLVEETKAKTSALVVGLDPVIERLPPDVWPPGGAVTPGAPGFTARAAAAVGCFLEGVLDVVADVAVAVKPNTAFFERLGPPGWDCLVRVCRRAQEAGLVVIADAKRGDIGSTAQAYADALLGDVPDTPGPYTDAVTLNPYLGSDSVEPFLERVRAGGKGVFVLVRTSNPSGREIQELDIGGEPLYVRVAELVHRWGADSVGSSGVASVGAVVGATVPEVVHRVRRALPHAPFLIPGYGAQGGGVDQLREAFLPGGLGAVVNASRSILYAGQSAPGATGSWKDAVRLAAAHAREDINAARGA